MNKQNERLQQLPRDLSFAYGRHQTRPQHVEKVMLSEKSASSVPAVERLPLERAEEAVGVLADAFSQYPVMQYVLGSANGSYDAHLHKMMRFFVAARFSRGEPVLAVSDAAGLAAVAVFSTPGQTAAPSSLVKHREALWRELGAAARARYDAMTGVWKQFSVPEPHYHLSMIGVKKSRSGHGFGRMLLDSVHDSSREDPRSNGVRLKTEDARNVPIYEHFGYEVIGHKILLPDLETWVMFRPDGR